MRRSLTALAVALAVVLLVAGAALATPGNIASTKHNLATGNPNAANVNSDEDEICVFCHTPHNARVNVPLWNRDASSASYTTYDSDTIDGTRDIIDGSSENISVLCLSCHDGTISLGAVVNNYPNGTDPTMSGAHVTAGKLDSDSRGLLGTDLTNDHPIAITYNTSATDLYQAADNKGPYKATDPQVLVFNDRVECASCHSVHNNTNVPFLRMSNAGSALCLECHKK